MIRATCAALLLAATFPAARPAAAAVSLGAWVQHSPDDISGFASMSGDNTANVTLPFTFTVEGTNYTTLVLSTNGWIEFGTNTSGGTDDSNDCLPTGAHTNPFLAAYWDDLNPFGTAVRYGTVGTSPNRTWIADFEVDLTAGSEGADDLRFQIQLHERSNLINVRYRDQQSATNGIGATIGYQGAGGASATTVQPLSCNGKVLDDNRPNEGWSADVGRAGQVVLSALMAHSPDDISGFATLSGDNATAGVTMPFSVTLEGASYNTLTIGTNGTIQFGTTSGSNPSVNTALPNASFPNPTLFYFWDDLQTEGGHIRYGSVGSSPNRTYIIDFQENLFASSGDKVNGQVQIHERSGLINVKYRSTLSNPANGQSATIGFQGVGGASAAAYPLTFNGKMLDDNRPDEGWSVHPQSAGAMSLHAFVEHSPDDIGGFATLSGNDVIAGVTMPFSIVIDGVSYNTITIGSNGLVQFGTTTGANPTTNGSLPSSSFPNPTLFYNWDDLQTEGGHIRYGSVGTSPHRTYIVDFQENRVGSTGDKVNGQVQIHEGSNVINVQYRSTLSGNSNGQNATIGFQGAGGASAAAYPLTFNGKILDDNLPDAGWSVAPLPICGNSILETKEQCDEGGANGSSGSCCTSTCGFKTAGTQCRASAGTCDAADNCTGSSGTCPADAKVTSGTTCRASIGVCDLAEACDGTNDVCPSDAAAPSGTLCRAAAGTCDVQEVCTGGTTCPADTLQPSGTLCRGAASVCDVDETCDGIGGDCPSDVVAPSGTPCRGAADVCDAAEVCTGGAPLCPTDAKQPSGTACRASADTCDVADVCDGSSDACPADGFASASVVCRGAADVCDTAENCTASGSACPADLKQPSGTSCRAAAGVCDAGEVCDGAVDACPADAKVASGTTCRAAAGSCDVDEACDGSGDDCPADAVQPSGFVCDPGSGDLCDPDELCDGSSPACPADTVTSAATVCRPGSGDVCDADETCTGTADAPCPPDLVNPTSTLCRTGSGDICDPDEFCPGIPAGTCAADVVAPPSTVCRPGSGDVCDPDELCPGVAAGTCAADVVAPPTTVCNPGSGDLCDPDEVCPGVPAGTCAADTVAPASTPCRAGVDICDVTDFCPGTADAACSADAKQPSGTVCRAAAGSCDAVEVCDGSTNACAADADLPDGSACSDGQFCNGAETCAAGSCSDQADPCTLAAICNESTDACQTNACPATPQGCQVGLKSKLVIKNNGSDPKDKLIWKFIKGTTSTSQPDFADPEISAYYALCIYEDAIANPNLVGTIIVPPSAAKWSQISSKGYKYLDATLAEDGTQKVIVKSSTSGKTKAILKGKGMELPEIINAGPSLTLPVRAQLYNYGTGLCWQGTYTAAIKNTASLFKAKQ